MRITIKGILPARYEVHEASAEDRQRVIQAIQMLELDYETPDFLDDQSPDLVVIATTEVKADQFESQFWPFIKRDI